MAYLSPYNPLVTAKVERPLTRSDPKNRLHHSGDCVLSVAQRLHQITERTDKRKRAADFAKQCDCVLLM